MSQLATNKIQKIKEALSEEVALFLRVNNVQGTKNVMGNALRKLKGVYSLNTQEELGIKCSCRQMHVREDFKAIIHQSCKRPTNNSRNISISITIGIIRQILLVTGDLGIRPLCNVLFKSLFVPFGAAKPQRLCLRVTIVVMKHHD